MYLLIIKKSLILSNQFQRNILISHYSISPKSCSTSIISLLTNDQQNFYYKKYYTILFRNQTISLIPKPNPPTFLIQSTISPTPEIPPYKKFTRIRSPNLGFYFHHHPHTHARVAIGKTHGLIRNPITSARAAPHARISLSLKSHSFLLAHL